jgi:mono/diheme cytochrome c family protein
MVHAATLVASEMKMHMLNRHVVLSLVAVVVLAVAGTSGRASSAVPSPSATPSPSPAPSPSVAALVGNAMSGKETFTQYCSVCHAVGATGFIGPWIAGVNWTTPGLHAIVRGGVGGYGSMPAFNANAVTDKNIADIAAYLASLPAAQGRAR